MSFARAAEELYVTPAALSYQIRNLETDLGVALFLRMNRSVELTEAGKLLAPGVAEGFRVLKAAVRNLDRLNEARGLVLTAGPAFTAKWLAPRLYRFVERNPGTELRLAASLRRMDFERDGVDAAVRFTRRSDEPGCYVEMLIRELLCPVCSPEVAARMKTPADLKDLPLIHDDSLAMMQRPPEWGDWLSAAGVRIDWEKGAHAASAEQALTAAAAGEGVALGRLSLAGEALRAGRLVTPFPIALDSGAHYNFVCPEGMETQADHAALLEWLREELRGEGAPGEGMTIVSPD